MARLGKCFVVALMIAPLFLTAASAATIFTADQAGATWTGFVSGVPDLSNTDYLDTIGNPFVVGTGSAVLGGASAPLTPAGLAVLNNGVGSTTNNQTTIINSGSGQFVRLMIDLQAGAGNSVFVEEFNSYGMVTVDATRHYQKYDLYGSNAASAPSIDGDPTTNGWGPIASVDVAFTNSQHRSNGVHVDDIDQDLRYLLFHAVNDNVYNGGWPGNHYVELDVVGTGPPPPPPLHPDLVSYWNFDESASGTGTAFDQQDGNHGTFNGTTIRTNGLIGDGAASYNGTNPSGVNVGTSLALTTGIAIEALVTSPNWDGNGFEEVFRKEDGGNRILFSLQPGRILSFGLNGGGGYAEFDVVLDGTGDKLTVAEFATGTHYLVANYDPTTGLQELYIDGVLQDSRTLQPGPDMISGGGAAAFIGSSNGGSESWDGIIDELAIYGAPLSAADMASHYQNFLSGRNYYYSESNIVPEPSTAALAGLGLVALIGCAGWRRRKRA